MPYETHKQSHFNLIQRAVLGLSHIICNSFEFFPGPRTTPRRGTTGRAGTRPSGPVQGRPPEKPSRKVPGQSSPSVGSVSVSNDMMLAPPIEAMPIIPSSLEDNESGAQKCNAAAQQSQQTAPSVDMSPTSSPASNSNEKEIKEVPVKEFVQ